MYTQATERSTLTVARTIGALYLTIIVTALFAELGVRARLIVLNDAATTAANILAHETLYRLGAVSLLIAITCDTAVALLFHRLLSPVNATVSMIAAAFRLVQVAILGANLTHHFAALVLIRDPQSHAQAIVFLRMYSQGFNLAMVFFGVNCALLGYLIVRSTYIPRVLGVLMAIAGVCYVANSLAVFVAPAFARSVSSFLLLPCFVAELALALWLLIKGLDVRRWTQLTTP